MENQETQQSKTSAEQVKRGNGGKDLRMAGLVLGIIATAFTIISVVIFTDKSSSVLSSPSEIAAQREFQDKLVTTQEEFQKKVGAATKEAEQKSDSILKAAEQN